jgi:hypothetical protein
MNSSFSRGFAALGLILVLVILASIGGAGWWYERQYGVSPSSPEMETGEALLPQFTLTAGKISKVGVPASYCWGHVCVDGVVSDLPESDVLRISASEELTLTIRAGTIPKHVSLRIREPVSKYPLDPSRITKKSLVLQPALKHDIDLSVPAGEYMVAASSEWHDGSDVTAVFKVRIEGETVSTKILEESFAAADDATAAL